jgi:hypothetical protein
MVSSPFELPDLHGISGFFAASGTQKIGILQVNIIHFYLIMSTILLLLVHYAGAENRS